MPSAAQLVNFACRETEDGFRGPLGGFAITVVLLGPSTATATRVAALKPVSLAIASVHQRV